MQCGLYGKLPAKRDFIALSTPREFLSLWETWIQGAVSDSTLRLGSEWRAAFLRAPIWRFWLGSDLCGETVIGAFMPSLDGIGRYFPLTLFTRAGEDEAIPPPELEPQIEWFAAVERFLLSTLDEGAAFEAISATLATLRQPIGRNPAVDRIGATFLSEGTVMMSADKISFSEVFTSARLADHAAAYASSTYWWTAGGEDYAPIALAKRRMPEPHVFAGMLTGDFGYLIT